MTVLLDPTSERSPTIRPRLPRPERLDGLKIGILDIAKARGDQQATVGQPVDEACTTGVHVVVQTRRQRRIHGRNVVEHEVAAFFHRAK